MDMDQEDRLYNIVHDLGVKVDGFIDSTHQFIVQISNTVTQIELRVRTLEDCIKDEKGNKKFLVTTLPSYVSLGVGLTTLYFLITKVWCK